MIEANLVVLTKALPGREADMEDWYSNIHIRDALRFRGSVTAQRFRLSDKRPVENPGSQGWQYLAFYDVFDPERFTQEHWENALTARMKISDAIDDSLLYSYHFYPVAFSSNYPALTHEGGLVLEQLKPRTGMEDQFRNWYRDTYLPAAMKRDGVFSGTFMAFSSRAQMTPTQPDQPYLGIFRVTGPDAFRGWQDNPLLAGSEFCDAADVTITCWDRATNKLTKDFVQHPNSAALAEEEAARERLGDRIIKTGADKLAIPD